MEMLGLNSKVLWPKLSAYFPPIPQLCPLIKEGRVREDCVCARHGPPALKTHTPVSSVIQLCH